MDKRIYPHPIFAKEGWPFMAGTDVLALLATAMGWGFLSVIFWALFILVVQFFRDPAREIPQGEKLVLSVVDGQVLKVEKAKDPYTGRDAILISVFMNLFNVHSQKSPVDGTVLKKVYRPGKYFNASLDKASAENEQCGLVVRADDGNLVTFVQIAGLVTHRILNYVKEGDHLNRGDRYGFIRFGSRVDMYLPLNARPKVVIGEKVWGTTTVLAVLGEALDEPEAPLDESEDSSVTAPAAAQSETPAAPAAAPAAPAAEAEAPEAPAAAKPSESEPAAAAPAESETSAPAAAEPAKTTDASAK